MIRSFYKYARNRYLGSILIILYARNRYKWFFIWASISIKGHNIVMLIKIQKSEKYESQSLFFQLKQQTLWLVFLLIIAILTNSNKLYYSFFLFSESFTWLFNCSLWVWYPSLGTKYYFWQHDALVIKKSSPRVLLFSADPTKIDD